MREEEVVLKGLPASPGVAKGNVVVLTSPSECGRMGEGNVLVAVETNPQYVPAMLKASAIVTDRGGILSHSAIVARELGIPGVVGTIKATKVLRDGMKVIVDGERGLVLRRDE